MAVLRGSRLAWLNKVIVSKVDVNYCAEALKTLRENVVKSAPTIQGDIPL